MPFENFAIGLAKKIENREIGENKKRLLELEKEGGYVFHGSPYIIEKMEPRQAVQDNRQTGQEENDGEPAIFASPFVDVAIFRSMVNEKIHSGDSSSGMGINDNNELSFLATQELLEEAKKISGQIYVFDRKDFIKDEARGLDLRCNKEISPIEVIEVNFKDLPENIKIIELNNESKISENKEKRMKQEKWDKVANQINKETDKLGYEIEKDIMDAVVALNVFGINTTQSCEGHADDEQLSTPWIMIQAPAQPEKQYIKEDEVFKKMAQKHGMSVDELIRKSEKYWDAISECKKNGETEEYKSWDLKNQKEEATMKSILQNFYENRNVPEDAKLKIYGTDKCDGFFVLHCGGDDYSLSEKSELTKDEVDNLREKNKIYLEEFNAFTKFLKDKYFSDGESYVDNIRKEVQEKVDDNKLKKIKEKLL